MIVIILHKTSPLTLKIYYVHWQKKPHVLPATYEDVKKPHVLPATYEDVKKPMFYQLHTKI